MDRSEYIARLMGPVMLIIGIGMIAGMLTEGDGYSSILKEFIASRALIFVTGVLALVAGKVPVLIEAKADPDRISRPRHLAAAIERAIAGYCGPIGVMSFHPLVPRWFARHAPAIRRGLVLRDSLPVLRRLLALHLGALRGHFQRWVGAPAAMRFARDGRPAALPPERAKSD